jgi:tRNA (guanine-N7-)-methyltransferase
MLKANKYPIIFKTSDLYATDLLNPILGIKTYYEQQWLSRGLSIKYIQFCLNKLDTFIEPEIELEYDSYRSFGRNNKKVVSI